MQTIYFPIQKLSKSKFRNFTQNLMSWSWFLDYQTKSYLAEVVNPFQEDTKDAEDASDRESGDFQRRSCSRGLPRMECRSGRRGLL